VALLARRKGVRQWAGLRTTCPYCARYIERGQAVAMDNTGGQGARYHAECLARLRADRRAPKPEVPLCVTGGRDHFFVVPADDPYAAPWPCQRPGCAYAKAVRRPPVLLSAGEQIATLTGT
jgi:hypothetical protein